MGAKKTSWNDSAPAHSEDSEPATHSWNFIKVYREPLEHLMFRGRMDWIGAWLLIQAAADRQTHRVNLTEVGRKADHDFGWDNDRWRRFVRRLEKEGFVVTVDKQNFGNKIGHVHIALLVWPVEEGSYGGGSTGEPSSAPRVQNTLLEGQSAQLERRGLWGDAGADAGAAVVAEGQELNNGVWLIVDDTDDEDVP